MLCFLHLIIHIIIIYILKNRIFYIYIYSEHILMKFIIDIIYIKYDNNNNKVCLKLFKLCAYIYMIKQKIKVI